MVLFVAVAVVPRRADGSSRRGRLFGCSAFSPDRFYRALAIAHEHRRAAVGHGSRGAGVCRLASEQPGVLHFAHVSRVSGVLRPRRRRAGRRRAATPHAALLVAAVGFGSFFAGMDRAEESGDVAWVLLAARAPEVLLLLAACAIGRPALPAAPRVLGTIAAIGSLDLLANFLFVLATGRGLLSVVGVLGALYPAVTVLLADALLPSGPAHRTRRAVRSPALCAGRRRLSGLFAIANSRTAERWRRSCCL